MQTNLTAVPYKTLQAECRRLRDAGAAPGLKLNAPRTHLEIALRAAGYTAADGGTALVPPAPAAPQQGPPAPVAQEPAPVEAPVAQEPAPAPAVAPALPAPAAPQQQGPALVPAGTLAVGTEFWWAGRADLDPRGGAPWVVRQHLAAGGLLASPPGATHTDWDIFMYGDEPVLPAPRDATPVPSPAPLLAPATRNRGRPSPAMLGRHGTAAPAHALGLEPGRVTVLRLPPAPAAPAPAALVPARPRGWAPARWLRPARPNRAQRRAGGR